MPELPDLTVYVEQLIPRIVGQTFEGVRLASPFLLRTATPPLSTAQGRKVLGVSRLGKRIIIELEDDLYLVLHLMIAGRLHWREHGKAIQGKIGLAAFDFSSGTLLLNEASQKKRAALYLEYEKAMIDQANLIVLFQPIYQFAVRDIIRTFPLTAAGWEVELFETSI